MSNGCLRKGIGAACLARLLVPALLLMGCNSLTKLFSSSSDSADAATGLIDASPGSPPLGGLDAAAAPDMLTVAGIDSSAAVSVNEPAPPSLAVESPAIVAVMSAMTGAITAQKFDTAAAQFVPEVRDRYAAMFAKAPAEKLTAFAAALAQISVTTVVLGAVNRADQRAEGTVTYDGRVFHVGFIKHNNTWLIESL
jgi:hypothetical protein